MLFPSDGVSVEGFVEHYWRKRPFVMRGVANRWSPVLAGAEYRRIFELLESLRPDLYQRNERGVAFGQNLDAVSPELRRLSEEVARLLNCANVWFDGVQTSAAGGIGCHFDNSDNFTMQLEGTKIWQVAEPSTIPSELRRLAMLRTPYHDDNVELPVDAEEIVLEPGDMLYIPLLWLHAGESTGPSLSTTITCNSESGLALIPYLHWALCEDPDWWGPVPTERTVGSRSAEEAADRLSDYFDRLFARLSEPHVQAKLRECWVRERFGQFFERFGVVDVPLAR